MTLNWIEGFESGEPSVTDIFLAGGGALETSITSYSSYAWKITVAAATGALYFGPTRDPWWGTAEDAGYLMFHMYIVTMPAGGEKYYLFNNLVGGVSRASAYIDGDDSKIYVRSEDDGAYVASSGTVQADTWYTVTIYKAAGAHTRIWVRERDAGTEVIDVAGSTGSVDRSMSQIYLGPWAASTGSIVFDNIVFDTTSDPYATLTDQYTIEALLPDGIGTNDDWTGSYTDLDDLPHDDAGTERTETANQTFTQTVEAANKLSRGPAAIVGVSTMGFAKTSAVGSSYNFFLRQHDGSNPVNSGNYGIGDAGPTAYTRQFGFHRVLAPDGGAWTVADLDALEVGAGRSTSGVGRTCSMTSVQAHVIYSFVIVANRVMWVM